MKKMFSLTLGQAKALRALLEDKLTNLELAKNENYIEKSFFGELHKYFNQRISDIEKQ